MPKPRPLEMQKGIKNIEYCHIWERETGMFTNYPVRFNVFAFLPIRGDPMERNRTCEMAEIAGKDKMNKYWLPWLVGMPAETSLAICSMIFGGVFERLPKLKVAFAHGGGAFPATIGRIEHGFKVRPDLCAVDNNVNPKDYLGKFYLDSLVHDPKMLDYIVSLMGEDKICLGTDYPFPLGELEPGMLIHGMDYSEEKKARLLGENAMEWLGLKKEDFI